MSSVWTCFEKDFVLPSKEQDKPIVIGVGVCVLTVVSGVVICMVDEMQKDKWDG